MTSTLITSELQKLAPSAVIEVYVLDLTSLGGAAYYFHAGTNQLTADLTWQGQSYVRYPIQATGFEFITGGQLPRPKLSVSNTAGTITALVLLYEDLVGAKITRKRTLKKYLDAVNFTGGVNADADPSATFPDDIFYVDRKSVEDRDHVEFELTCSFDVQGVQLPRRQLMQNSCPWVYRSAECSYTGTDYFLTDDTATASVGLDVCGKRLSSCKARFGAFSSLPFGGFPSVGTFK